MYQPPRSSEGEDREAVQGGLESNLAAEEEAVFVYTCIFSPALGLEVWSANSGR